MNKNFKILIVKIIRFSLISSFGIGGGIALLRFMFMFNIKKVTINDFIISFNIGFTLGLLFTIFWLLLTFLLDLNTKLSLTRNQSRKYNWQDIWDIEQERQIELEGDFVDILYILRESSLNLPNITNVSEDKLNMNIRAKTSISFSGAGEIIDIDLKQIESNRWHIKILSKPLNKNQLFDFSKNYHNAENLILNIINLAKQKNVKIIQ